MNSTQTIPRLGGGAALRDYESHITSQGSGALLGRLCWYTVTETTVPHATLAAEMAKAGLDQHIPRPPCDSDVFRRVFSNGQRRRLDRGADVVENLLIRLVAQEDGKLIKRVVVEQVDQAGKRLGYREALEIVFDTASPDTVSTTVIGDLHIEALQLASELHLTYKRARGTVNAQAVRDMLRRALDGAMATCVRPGGGVYFVMEDKAGIVGSLEQLAAAIPGCDVHGLPLPDDRKQRDMLKRAFESESVEAIDRQIEEIIELVNAGEEVSERKFKAIQAARAAAMAKTREYTGLLSDNLSQTEFRLRMLDGKMAQLLGLVKPGQSRRSA